MEPIEWTPLFAAHTNGYIVGYSATIPGCLCVTVQTADLRSCGYTGVDWRVHLKDGKFQPAPFKAHGTVDGFNEAKAAIVKVLDLAVSMGWIPEYRVQA